MNLQPPLRLHLYCILLILGCSSDTAPITEPEGSANEHAAAHDASNLQTSSSDGQTKNVTANDDDPFTVGFGNAIEAGLNDMFKKLDAREDFEKQLILLACKGKIEEEDERFNIRIVLFRPSKTEISSQQYKVQSENKLLTVQMTRIQTRRVSVPLAVLTTVRLRQDKADISERVVHLDPIKGWLTAP